MQSGQARSESFNGVPTQSQDAVLATHAAAPETNEKKSTVENKTLGTLPPRAVDGFRRKLLTRRRHQDGQLIELQNGYAVRYYEDHEGQRVRVQKFLGDFSELPTARAAKNVMQAEMVKVNQQLGLPSRSTLTFRVAAKEWIAECETRKLKPIKASVAHNWKCILRNHLNPLIGELSLSDVGNKTLRSVVAELDKKGLAPATINNIALVVKLVVGSVTDDDGERIHLRHWNKKVIDAPEVDARTQHKPGFTSEQVTSIVKAATGRMQMAAILFAATGLRAGELLGLECRHFDGESVKVEQSVWGGDNKVGKPKTAYAYRTVDLHPDVASLLKSFVGTRTKGFILQTSGGKPVTQTNLLRRELHPLLDSLKIPLCGFHAFRRFRNTFLRQSRCPDALLKFWMGHSPKDMSDLYDKSAEDLPYRRHVAKAMGVGFELPKTLTAKPPQGALSGVTDVSTKAEEMEAIA
jgi:integrase